MQTCTLLTRSPAALVAHLTRLSASYADHTLLFTLSPNVPPTHLSALVTRLTTFSRTTLGCLAAPLPHHHPRIACSLALFPSSSSAVPFRSTIPGRPSPQVGRWHAFRNKDNHDAPRPPTSDLNWAQVWNRNAGGTALPPDLQHINPTDVNEVLYLTDRAPEGLINSLAAFPHATKLGLIAASTPFITGRPVTLFHNSSIHDSGAIGLALLKPRPRATAPTQFLGLLPISPIMTVTACEGNMLNTLDNTNPTQLLLTAIRKTGIDMHTSGSFKDDETFLLGVVPNAAVQQMYSITAGDPLRGNIALASQNAPAVGTPVQFFHRPKSAKAELPVPSPREEHVSALRFLACAETSFDLVDVDGGDSGEVEVLHDVFIAASENGFVLSRADENAWTCTVPGGVASLEWP